MSLQEVDKQASMAALVTEYHRRRFTRSLGDWGDASSVSEKDRDRSMTLARKADRLAKLSRVLIVIGRKR